MEDSPHAAKVLQGLVDQNYVKRFRNMDEARLYFKGDDQTLSKTCLLLRLARTVSLSTVSSWVAAQGPNPS